MDLIVVRTAYDPDVGVWYIETSDPLCGLNIEAETLDELRDKIPNAVADLYEMLGKFEREVSVEIIARTSIRLRTPAAA
jgi:Domain of unknown function (DUF1902)